MALALLLAGCASTRLFYNNLDWIVPWQLDRYFDVEDPQDALLDEYLPRHWQWHRRTQLGAYVADLRALADAAEQAMPRAQVEDFQARMRAHLQSLWEQVRPDVGQLLATLDDEQVADLLQRIREDWDEDASERSEDTPAEHHERQLEQTLDSLERWAGDLDQPQVELVSAWLAGRPDEFAMVSAYRLAWWQAFQSLLDTRATPGFVERFVAFSEDPKVALRPAYLAYRSARRGAWVDLLTRLSASQTNDQRAHVRDELSELADDFETLATQGDG